MIRCSYCYSRTCSNDKCISKPKNEETLFDYKFKCISNPNVCQRLFVDKPKWCSKCAGTNFEKTCQEIKLNQKGSEKKEQESNEESEITKLKLENKRLKVENQRLRQSLLDLSGFISLEKINLLIENLEEKNTLIEVPPK